MTHRFLSLLGCLLPLVLTSLLPAQEEKSRKPAEKFALIRIEDDFRIVPKSQVTAVKKELKAEDEEAAKDWAEAKKAAKKAKEAFEDPKPKRRRVQVLGSSFKTSADAEKARDALLEKEQARKKKKRSGSARRTSASA